ncbi:MAG: hypothetical protein JJE25_09215 [Bacteroidia bacterium]|nr:hypothetical protein [Bacteroidia bacterium]
MDSRRKFSALFLVIAASFAALQIAERHEGKIFKLVFLLLIVAQMPSLLTDYFKRWKLVSSQWFAPTVYFSVSFISAAIIFRFWHFPLFDDAGFILRYLDNFADGHFYAFNAQDGPVFGVSSFSQGIINGVLCWTHLLAPDKSVVVTAFTGLFIISVFILKILNRYEMKTEMIFLSYIIILFGSKFFLNSMTTGMETPIHLAIVLAAIYFFIVDNSGMMWLMLSASVISKLDAVPLALTLGSVHLFQHRTGFFPVSWKNKNIRELILCVILPIGLWIAFAFAVFGNPLPQSAYAKIFFHFHSDDSWFPFLDYFIKNELRKPFFIVFLFLFFWNAYLVASAKSKVSVRSLAFGLSFFATLLLYYFYNPIEQMSWYYAMPDLFLIFQTVISFIIIVESKILPSFKPAIIYFSFIAAALLLFYDSFGGRNWIKQFLNTTEQERITVGKYLQSITSDNDTVIATHGHIARYTSAYVIDMTGLNSKLVTNYQNDLAIVASKFPPSFAVSHGTDYFLRTMDSLGYTLIKSYYDISEYYWPAWRIFSRKISDEEGLRLGIPDSTDFKAKEVRMNFGVAVIFSDTIEINLPDDASLSEIRFGVKRAKLADSLSITIQSDNSELGGVKRNIPKEKDIMEETPHFTVEVSVPVDSTMAQMKNKKIIITASRKEQLEIIEPLFLFHR